MCGERIVDEKESRVCWVNEPVNITPAGDGDVLDLADGGTHHGANSPANNVRSLEQARGTRRLCVEAVELKFPSPSFQICP